MTINRSTIEDPDGNQLYRKILVGYDGSENANRALGRAIELVRRTEGELTIVVVAEAVSHAAYAMGQSYRPIHANMVDYAKNVLSGGSERAKQAGITGVHGSVEEGRPADMILARASEIKADLIVLGRRGISGIERLLLGSVSSSVMRHSTSDVLIVK